MRRTVLNREKRDSRIHLDQLFTLHQQDSKATSMGLPSFRNHTKHIYMMVGLTAVLIRTTMGISLALSSSEQAVDAVEISGVSQCECPPYAQEYRTNSEHAGPEGRAALCQPDGFFTSIGNHPGETLILDMGAGNEITDGPDIDFYYYERPFGLGIYLDQVEVAVAQDDGTGNPGPFVVVLIWGDDNPNNNGTIPSSYFPESANLEIAGSDLHLGMGFETGIGIDIGNDDGQPYRYVRFQAFPVGSVPRGDYLVEVDAVERIHPPTFPTPIPSPSSTETPTPTETQAPAPSETGTPTLTATPSPSPTDTPTNTETPTYTPPATDTPSPTDTPTETATTTPSPNETQTATETATPSLTHTTIEAPTKTPTYTLTPSYTPTPPPTFTPTYTPTNTVPRAIAPTEAPTLPPIIIVVVAPTPIPTRTPALTPSATHTHTPSSTPTETPTSTSTPTPDLTETEARIGTQTAETQPTEGNTPVSENEHPWKNFWNELWQSVAAELLAAILVAIAGGIGLIFLTLLSKYVNWIAKLLGWIKRNTTPRTEPNQPTPTNPKVNESQSPSRCKKGLSRIISLISCTFMSGFLILLMIVLSIGKALSSLFKNSGPRKRRQERGKP